jgi:hypothetical protein
MFLKLILIIMATALRASHIAVSGYSFRGDEPVLLM